MKRILSAVLLCCSAYMLSAKTVKVGYYIDAGNFMSGLSEEDERAGYAYEYLQNIASYTDWEYEYVYGYWDALYEKLLKGEIDFLTDVSYTPERENLFYYPEYPMAQENYYLYALKDNSSINSEDLSSLDGKSMQLGRGSYQYELFKKWLKRTGVKINVKECSYLELSEKDFNEGVYDLYLSMDLVSEPDWEPVIKIGYSDVYVVVTKERPDLLKELIDAQNNLYRTNPYYNSEMWTKYFSKTTSQKHLNQNEKKWISEKNVLNIGCFKNDAPYSIYDEWTGETDGIIKFLVDEMKENFNLSDLKVNYSYYNQYNEVVDAIKSGEVDFAFPFVYELCSAENNKIALSRPIMNESFCLVHQPGIGIDEIKKKIAVEKSSRAGVLFNKSEELKNSVLKYYDTPDECLDAIIVGEVNSALFEISDVSALIYGRKKYKNLINTEIGKSEGLCFAADNKNIQLMSIINKVGAITDHDNLHQEIINYSVKLQQYSFYDFIDDYISVIIAVVFILLLLIVALSASVYHIKMLVNYDVLTHLLNRRSLKDYIHRYIEKADKHNDNFCVVIFDVDNFKQINDTYGHEVGDEVLKISAEVIQKSIALEDKVFRWGGEEFLVLLNTNKILAEKIANRIRINLAAHVFEKDGEEFFVTLTGGLSVYKPGMEYKEMFVEADKNLYRGKELGKNVIIS
jgi:diguanylate cyclase (GGDEF)-like protein